MDNLNEHSSTFDLEIRLYGGYPLYEKKGQTYMAIMEDAYIGLEKLDHSQPQLQLCFQRLYEDLNNQNEDHEDFEDSSIENNPVKKRKIGRQKRRKTHLSARKNSRKTKPTYSRPTLSEIPSDKLNFSAHEEQDNEYVEPNIFNDDTINIFKEENHTDPEKVIYFHNNFLIMSQNCYFFSLKIALDM